MEMTMDDKEKCAALYEAFSGKHTEPSRWNEKAGDLLAEMVDKIKECTRGMGLARSVWPSAHKITWLWVVKIPYHIIRNEIMLSRDRVITACLKAGVDAYEEQIEIELMK